MVGWGRDQVVGWGHDQVGGLGHDQVVGWGRGHDKSLTRWWTIASFHSSLVKLSGSPSYTDVCTCLQ